MHRTGAARWFEFNLQTFSPPRWLGAVALHTFQPACCAVKRVLVALAHSCMVLLIDVPSTLVTLGTISDSACQQCPLKQLTSCACQIPFLPMSGFLCTAPIFFKACRRLACAGQRGIM